MNVKEILDLNTIKVNLKARNKKEALDELIELLYKENYITEKEQFTADIYEREAIGQTGIGNYIAIPHGRSNAVQKIGVAIGKVSDEIEWETLDGKGVKVIFLFCVGDDNQGAENHLKLLSLFARKLGNDEVVEQILNSEDELSVLNAFE